MMGGRREGYGGRLQQNGLKQAGQGHGFAEAQARFLFDTPSAFAASGQMNVQPLP